MHHLLHTYMCVETFSQIQLSMVISLFVLKLSLQFIGNHARLGDNHMFCDLKGTYINMVFSTPC